MASQLYTLTSEYQELFGQNPSILVMIDYNAKGWARVAPVGVGGRPIYRESFEVNRDDLQPFSSNR